MWGGGSEKYDLRCVEFEIMAMESSIRTLGNVFWLFPIFFLLMPNIRVAMLAIITY